MRACPAWYLFAPGYLRYGFGADHPMQPRRLEALTDLLRTAGLLDRAGVRVIEPRPALDEELLLTHAPAFIETVHLLSDGGGEAGRAEQAGLGDGDTPAFLGMYEASALIVGGTLTAARAVMRGETTHAFNPGGGLHHAHRRRASGFCIFNDLSVAIAAIVQEHEAKVMYVDLDVHHGDGVQNAFYDDPRVLTVSFHETGRYLFPGTGAVLDLGTGPGLGFSINVPMGAFTQDASWVSAVEALVPALAERFRPDLIVSQFGCDGHAWDDQAHFRLSTSAFAQAARIVHEVAHDLCGGRWVATGGGGYDPVRVVPRVWSLLWSEMTGQPLPAALPAVWLARWTPLAHGPMPDHFLDPPDLVPEIPRRPAIEAENAATVARVRELALSPHLRQAYRPAGSWTPSMLPALPDGRTTQVNLVRGALYLRDRCPKSLVRRMRVAEGMSAFSRSREREQAMFERIASSPENNLVIAHTPDGEIVGELTMAPADGRWSGVDSLYEAAIEVAPAWRHTGLAEALLHFAFEPEFVERLVVIAIGMSWHWDLQGTGMTPWQYRDRIVRLFRAEGFEVFPTDDPDITAGEANVLMARVGRLAPHAAYDEFYRRLQSRGHWIGL